MRNPHRRSRALAATILPAAFLAIVTVTLSWRPLEARATSPSTAAPAAPGLSSGTPRPEDVFDDQVLLSGDVDVPRGSAVGEVVVFHGTVSVEGVVRGDVVVLSGPVTVSGQVSGSVVTLDGTITLRSSAQVGRDVLGGDTVSVERGAYVGGRLRQNTRFTLSPAVAALGVLLASLMMAGSTLIIGLALLLLAPRGVERVADTARRAAWPSAGWGVLLSIVLPVAAVAAMVTVVGLALGLSLLLALSFLFLIGLAETAWSVGRAIVPTPRTRWGAFFAGWGIVALLGLVPVLNVIVWIAGSIFGLGAIVVAVWRTRHEPPIVLPAAPTAPPSNADLPDAPVGAPPGA